MVTKLTDEEKQKLIDRVIDSMEEDFRQGDVVCLKETLLRVDWKIILEYLPDHEQQLFWDTLD